MGKIRDTATKFWKLESRWISSNEVFQLTEQKRPNHKPIIEKMKKAELKVAPNSSRNGSERERG